MSSSNGDCVIVTSGVDARYVVIILLTVGAVLILVFILVMVLIVVTISRVARLKAALYRALSRPAVSPPPSLREVTVTGQEAQDETEEVFYEDIVDTTTTRRNPPPRGLTSRNESLNLQAIALKENSAYAV